MESLIDVLILILVGLIIIQVPEIWQMVKTSDAEQEESKKAMEEWRKKTGS